MMSDLIKRDDAIKVIEQNSYCVGERGAKLKIAIAEIKALPSADRPQGWIPCSERLPKDWEHVLVCTTVTYTTPIFVDWYVDEVGSWANEGDSVIAWMPLPKPWKGADDE